AGNVILLLHQHRCRQVARLGVDGVAEQHELHQRHSDHGRERDAVAAQLQEFLEDHRADAAPEVPQAVVEHPHWKLSLARLIRSMNTSSSDGSDASQSSVGSLRYGAMAPSSFALSRAETCSFTPKGVTSTSGLSDSSWESRITPLPLTV